MVRRFYKHASGYGKWQIARTHRGGGLRPLAGDGAAAKRADGWSTLSSEAALKWSCRLSTSILNNSRTFALFASCFQSFCGSPGEDFDRVLNRWWKSSRFISRRLSITQAHIGRRNTNDSVARCAHPPASDPNPRLERVPSFLPIRWFAHPLFLGSRRCSFCPARPRRFLDRTGFRCRGRFDRRDPSRAASPHLVPPLFLTLYQLRFPKLHISPSHRFTADTELLTERVGRGQRRPGFKLTALDEFAYLPHHLRLEWLLSVALEPNRKFGHPSPFEWFVC